MSTNLASGKSGEEIAANYLKSLQYKIVERNYRNRNGEIDIIAVEKSELVFVEVKTRHSSAFGTPFEALTSWKLQFVVRAAEYYKHTHKGLPDQMRIDAIAVTFDNSGKPIIEHLKNVSS